MKKKKLKNTVSEAVIVKVGRKKHFVYVTSENNCEVIKIVSYSNFSKEESQTLLAFKNSVFLKIAYDGEFLYVARRNMEKKLEKYRIYKEEGIFLVSKVKEIELPDKMTEIQSMVSSNSGKIAIFDVNDGSIYEIVDDKLEFVKCTKNNNCIMHQELCYIGEKLYSTVDFRYKENQIRNINLLCYHNYTKEMIYGDNNILYFEKENNNNGNICLENKRVFDIKSCGENLVVCCNLKSTGYIIGFTPEDLQKEKSKSKKRIEVLNKKKEKVINMIASCSGGNERVFIDFSREFEIVGLEMYEMLTKVKKEHLTGIEAFRRYIEYKYN